MNEGQNFNPLQSEYSITNKELGKSNRIKLMEERFKKDTVNNVIY